jgi:hypothetical protein
VSEEFFAAMHTTLRIREDIARATIAFLGQADSVHSQAFTGMIARSVYESPTNSRWSSGLGHHLAAWKGVTAQQIVDDLLRLHETSGGSARAHDRSIYYIIQCWDRMLKDMEELPVPQQNR